MRYARFNLLLIATFVALLVAMTAAQSASAGETILDSDAPAVVDPSSDSPSAPSTDSSAPSTDKPPTDSSAPSTDTSTPTDSEPPATVDEPPVTSTPTTSTPPTTTPDTPDVVPTCVKNPQAPGCVPSTPQDRPRTPVGGGDLPFTGPGDVVLAIVLALLAGTGGILFLTGATGREQLDGLQVTGMDSPSGFKLAYRELLKQQTDD